MNGSDHALPQSGGSFIRQADGSLVPAEAADAEPTPDTPTPAPPRGKVAAEKE